MIGAEHFLDEIKTTANLQHPYILPLHDSGEADGFLYYVMPYGRERAYEIGSTGIVNIAPLTFVDGRSSPPPDRTTTLGPSVAPQTQPWTTYLAEAWFTQSSSRSATSSGSARRLHQQPTPSCASR